jgi:mono/diheme cytochrome c family protein
LAVAALLTQGGYAETGKESEQAGATLFRDKGCAYCHGANTQGTPKGPSLLAVRKLLKAQQIADQIKNGGQKMPSFEESLSPVEISELVSYLRAKHRPAPGPAASPEANPASAPAKPEGNESASKLEFVSNPDQ